jgi:hypothetical protein
VVTSGNSGNNPEWFSTVTVLLPVTGVESGNNPEWFSTVTTVTGFTRARARGAAEMAGDDTQSGHPMTTDEREQMLTMLAPLLAPQESWIQEVRPGVYTHCWRWEPIEIADERSADDADAASSLPR